MKLIISVLCVLYACFSFAQTPISSRLSNEISERLPSEKIWVSISFKDNVNCFALKNQFNIDKIPVTERPKLVISALQDQKKRSQTSILLYLKDNQDKVTEIYSYWLVNTIICKIQVDFIPTLSQFSKIALVDYENSKFVWEKGIKVKKTEGIEKSVGGVEPGLEAINARPLWNLGYTGRGTLVFDYDTGNSSVHPAFADRFLAHYRPMSQAWKGWRSAVPSAIISQHGTHTMGTIGGLVDATNDTIGVAFGTYWIANDLIGTTTANMPPLAELIASFQWALNPDGDINTSDDVPAAINNSWRWYDGDDTTQCAGNIVALMNAIEAAGIANVFAGGNFGPSNITVSAPQRINTTEVNTFSVGAVDGNQPYPYPIASFSSRGPKQCPAPVGPLLIHPEVVAPGVNVRSSIGANDYAVFSGTSMATPHVTGAVLLLKEAFPYLTGEDFLWALYLTAIDFGAVGEDNVYGRGMIDVYAAFQYLAQTNTPVNPFTAITDDASIKVIAPTDGAYSCNETYNPKVIIKNLASNTIGSATIYYSLNGAPEQSVAWTGSLLQNESDTLSLPSFTSQQLGKNIFNVRIETPANANEYDVYNNQYYVRFNIRPEINLPYAEDFESNFYDGDWNIVNPDNELTWTLDSVVTKSPGGNVIKMEMYAYYPVEGQTDLLISPKINLPTGENITLKFDWSYYRRTHALIRQDTLLIVLKTNCETAILDTVLNAFADSLETGDTLFLDFEPKYPSHWKTKYVDLTSYAGQQVSIAFKTVNRNGNNLYLDNIGVYSDNHPLGIKEQSQPLEILVYPNPNNGNFTLQVPQQIIDSSTKIQLYNTIGELILEENVYNKKQIIHISNLPNGLYLLRLITNDKIMQKRIIKK